MLTAICARFKYVLPLLFLTSLSFGDTKSVVPRAAHEGQVGTSTKPWNKVVADELIGSSASIKGNLIVIGSASLMGVVTSTFGFIGANSTFTSIVINGVGPTGAETGIKFAGSPNSVLTQIGDDTFSFSHAGAGRGYFSVLGLIMTNGRILSSYGGTAAQPDYTFTSPMNNYGMYRTLSPMTALAFSANSKAMLFLGTIDFVEHYAFFNSSVTANDVIISTKGFIGGYSTFTVINVSTLTAVSSGSIVNLTVSSMSVTSGKTVISGISYQWPGTEPTNGQVLGSDANNNLSWQTPSAGGGGAVFGYISTRAINMNGFGISNSTGIELGTNLQLTTWMSTVAAFESGLNISTQNIQNQTVILGSTAPYRSISLAAPAWIGMGVSSANADNNGFTKTSSYTATNSYQNLPSYFQELYPSTRTMIESEVEMPYEWDGSSIGITITWLSTGSITVGQNTRLCAAAVGFSSGSVSTTDTIFTSSAAVFSTYTGGYRVTKTPTISITPEGGVKGGDFVKIVIFNDGGDGANNFTGVVRFLNATILYRQAIWDGKPR